MSVGNVTQVIRFTDHTLTLVLGENLDLQGQGNRNGTGKTVILNALSFVLYGVPIVAIKKDNLINDENGKKMLVSLDYEIDGKYYKIERGRKPNFCRYFVNNALIKSPVEDETAGESKWTQASIERDLSNLSQTLFKYIISLHIKTIPFLSLRDATQREVIEELLSITQLSQKSESLKEQMKQIKDEIKEEEIKIKTTIDFNEKIQRHITDLRFKSSIWERSQVTNIRQLQQTLSEFAHIDIDLEITAHKNYETMTKHGSKVSQLQYRYQLEDTNFNRIECEKERLANELSKLDEHSCPTCGQYVHDGKLVKLKSEIEVKIGELVVESERFSDKLHILAGELEALSADEPQLEEIDFAKLGDTLAYNTLEDSLNHRHRIATLISDLEREKNAENPFIEQIAGLSTSASQIISYNYLNELSRVQDHQEFLYKMLTSKESFIRKKIIDQSLAYLNRSLNLYLSQLNLPHEVVFKNDLSVDITKLGKDYDYDQLSSGQSNRLILGMAWAFRDTWESMNHRVNLLMIDELIDSGLDSVGTNASVDILMTMARDQNRNVFLISHKEDLEQRVDDILLVQMENKFTTYSDTAL